MKKVIIIMCSVTFMFCLGIVGVFIMRICQPITNPLISPLTVSTDDLHINSEGKLNINVATAQELAALNGIGEVLSERIVDYREKHGPFKEPSDLLKIKGIGQTKLDNIIDQICVE